MTTTTRTLQHALTVADLIAELEQYDEETPVLFVCDYGDYCHTQQALPIESIEKFAASKLSESAYSQSGLALDDSDEEEGFYCQTCDEEWTIPTCPKCKARCVTEDGTPAPEEDEDTTPVIILR